MTRRCTIVLCLTLLACSTTHPISSSGLESEEDEPDAPACSVHDAAQRFKRASQVDYDYEPSTPEALFARSLIVARGRITAVRTGVPEQTTPSTVTPTLDVELALQDVYKGATTPGNRVRFSIVSAPVVSEAERNALLTLPEDVSVVAFLTNVPGASDPPSTTSGSVLRVTSPQGLVVASPCGVSPTLDSLPLFDAQVRSLTQLDAVLRASNAP